MNELVIDK